MLIKTKLNIPLLRSRLLERTHLLNRLSIGKSFGIILITGQAGSGKTSLVSQWAMQNDLSVAWYSLDETDNKPDLFFRYLLTTLANTNRELSEKLGPLLNHQEKISAKDVFPFIIELLGDLTDDLYLVLDDYHFISSEEIHESIYYLLRYLPSNFHIIIISRQNVPFSLSSFRVRNQIMEIQASDLKLTDTESELFLSEMMNVRLTDDMLRELIRYTEGWIGGLQMICLSLHKRDNLNNLEEILTTAGRITAEYLIDEMINDQPEKVRKFLCDTILLTRFNTELCQYITGNNNVNEILDYLLQTNQFIIPLNAEGTWYRYQDLFSDTLRTRVIELSDQNPSEIHKKAAIWFAKHNYLEEAFQHAFAVDYEFASDLMEDYLFKFFDQYDVAGARHWLSKLPRYILRQSTILRLDECAFKILSRDFGELDAIIKGIEREKEKAFSKYKGDKKRRCVKKFFYLKHFFPYLRDPTIVNVDQTFEGFQQINADDHFFYGNVYTIVALNNLFQGNILQAESDLEIAGTSVFSSQNTYLRIMWSKAIVEVEQWKGKLRSMERKLEKVFQSLGMNEIDPYPNRFFLYSPVAYLSYLRDDLEKALYYSEKSLINAKESKHIHDFIEANFLLAKIYLAMGEPGKISTFIEGLRNAPLARSHGVVVSADAYITILSIAIGDYGTAEKWVERRKLKLNEGFSVKYYFESLAYALLHLQQRKYSEAIIWLKALRTQCLKRNMMLGVLYIDLLYSSALFNSDEKEEANSIMEESLSFAETENCIRPFIDYVRFISPVLMNILEKYPYRKGNLFFEKILDNCGDIAQESTVRKILANTEKLTLSQRELEILQLMSLGYRNKEIAQKAYISLSTVKTHINHIFQKLGVETRVQAISRAHEMKLSNYH